MKLIVATVRNMPTGTAIVIALATAEEVRAMEWAEPEESKEIPSNALTELIKSIKS